jgi:glycine/D-amino acid oxidase-like deaminating enzyme
VADSYWLAEPAPALVSRPLAGAAEVEVVGGGVTGISCALTLAQAGKRVRLHEARAVASGASGRNGGFALRGGAMAYDSAREWLGREQGGRVLEPDRGLRQPDGGARR